MTKQPAVYILTNKRNGTLYVGVTSNLVKRVWEHKSGAIDGFTKRYGLHELVWYEMHESMESAIEREKAWKLGLIEENNPDWHDLYESLI
jgi:putative endonuclease